MLTTNTNNTTVDLEVFIKGKNLNNLDVFVKPYTMKEHFSDTARKEGSRIALEKFPEEVVSVYVSPLTDDLLEDALREHLKMEPSHKLISQIHNPMDACFGSYTPINLLGVDLLIYKACVGVCYAVINLDWQAEYTASLNY